MLTDLVCAGHYAVNYRQLMEFVSLLMLHMQDAVQNSSVQDTPNIAKHLSTLHKTTNRVVRNLLALLVQKYVWYKSTEHICTLHKTTNRVVCTLLALLVQKYKYSRRMRCAARCCTCCDTFSKRRLLTYADVC
jgi:hypothetical protein